MLSSTANSTLRWLISLALFLALTNAAIPPQKPQRSFLKRHDNETTRRAVIPHPKDFPHRDAEDPSASDVICRAEGLCERCPESSIHEPFCQPYGNRRLIKCLPNTAENARLMRQHAHDDDDESKVTYNLGETPAWEACGKVIVLERADYWEFLMCNFLFASFSMFIVLYRSKQIAALQYRKLAARIGLSSVSS